MKKFKNNSPLLIAFIVVVISAVLFFSGLIYSGPKDLGYVITAYHILIIWIPLQIYAVIPLILNCLNKTFRLSSIFGLMSLVFTNPFVASGITQQIGWVKTTPFLFFIPLVAFLSVFIFEMR